MLKDSDDDIVLTDVSNSWLIEKFNILCGKGELTKIRDLLQDRDVNQVKGKYGTGLLQYACGRGCYEIASYLIDEKCADIFATNEMGFTPLHAACIKSSRTVAGLLLERGTEGGVNRLMTSADHQGNTPLHIVCFSLGSCTSSSIGSGLELLELLLTNGADIHAKNEADLTAFDLIRNPSHLALALQALKRCCSGLS